MNIKQIKDKVELDIKTFEDFMRDYNDYMTDEEKTKCVELYKNLTKAGEEYIRAAKMYYQRQN